MAVFVLVHGAWLGGWCWDRVARRLRDAGHHVVTPTLAGLGDRCDASLPVITLDTHIAEIAALISADGMPPVVLCGHGYGGMVIAGAADRVPGAVEILIYLDCLIPEDGDSTFDMWAPARQMLMLESAATLGGAYVPAPDMANFGLNPGDRDWVQARMTPHPLASFRQPIRLSGVAQRIARKVFVIAQDRVGGELFFDKYNTDPSWQGFRIKAGHALIFDEPAMVAAVLLEAVKGA